MCVHTLVSNKNQSSSQVKGFMHGLVQKILGTCERGANIFLHPGANYTYMFNLHTVCKSAHVNGALDAGAYTADNSSVTLSLCITLQGITEQIIIIIKSNIKHRQSTYKVFILV